MRLLIHIPRLARSRAPAKFVTVGQVLAVSAVVLASPSSAGRSNVSLGVSHCQRDSTVAHGPTENSHSLAIGLSGTPEVNEKQRASQLPVGESSLPKDSCVFQRN